MRLALILSLALITTACQHSSIGLAPMAIERADTGAGARSVLGRVLVKWKDRAAAKAVYDRLGVSNVGAVDAEGLDAVDLPPGVSASALRAEAGAALEYTEPDYILSTFATPNDPLLPRQYALKKVDAARAWQTQRGSADVRIAIVDTGADLDHPDLAGQIVGSTSTIGWKGRIGVGSARDENGHGTHCAGVAAAAANNGEGIAGMAPGCKLLVVKALGPDGSGPTSDIARGIHWAVDHGASVISLSIGGTGDGKALRDAVSRALRKGVVVVAAMGNEGKHVKNFPAAYPGVIGVGATGRQNEPARFSNRGAWISVAAPGVSILSTTPTYDVFLSAEDGLGRGYGRLSGTSMATPLVAGIAALVKSQHPEWSPKRIKQAIERSASGDGTNERTGHGIVSAAAALGTSRAE